MNVISLEINFSEFVFVTLLQCTAKLMFVWYIISRQQFLREIHEVTPTQNLRLLQYPKGCLRFTIDSLFLSSEVY